VTPYNEYLLIPTFYLLRFIEIVRYYRIGQLPIYDLFSDPPFRVKVAAIHQKDAAAATAPARR